MDMHLKMSVIDESNANKDDQLPVNIAIRKRFIELSADSSAHGYHNIYKTKYTFLRIFWIFFVVISTAFCLFLVVNSIRDYLKFEVTTKTRIERQDKMKFPMISFCNYKPFMTKAAQKYTIKEFNKEFFEMFGVSPPDNVTQVLYGNTNDENLKAFVDDGYIYWLVQIIQNKLSDPDFDNSTLRSFGFNVEDFFVDVYLGNKTLYYEEHFTWYYDPFYGNCYRFNSGKMENGSQIEILEQNVAGYSEGLQTVNFIDVYPKQAYSFMSLGSVTTTGLKISIDDQNDFPLTYSKMLSFKPGTCTYINLKKTVTKSLPRPYSNCQDLTNFHSVIYDKIISLNKTYSQKVCYAMCQQKKVTDTCNCSVYIYPNVDRYSACKTEDDRECVDYLWGDDSGCKELCPLECESTSYDFTTTFDEYPDQYTFNLKRAEPSVIDHFEKVGFSGSEITYDDLARSLACLKIYYNEFSTTTIEESKAMTWVS
jgi:hypothetical protein